MGLLTDFFKAFSENSDNEELSNAEIAEVARIENSIKEAKEPRNVVEKVPTPSIEQAKEIATEKVQEEGREN